MFKILDNTLTVKGEHNRLNLLAAAAALYFFGADPEITIPALSDFRGIPDRMEFVAEKNGISFYNDTTATIPEAVTAAADSFKSGVRLISGGTDKDLDFEVLKNLKNKTEMIYLLEGTATDKIIPVLNKYNIDFKGTFSSLEECFKSAVQRLKTGIIL